MASLLNMMAAEIITRLDDPKCSNVFHVQEVLTWACPGTPQGSGFVSDAMRHWPGVRNKVKAERPKVLLVPVTDYFFRHCNGNMPDPTNIEEGENIREVVGKCVAGTWHGEGPAVGYVAGGKDLLTECYVSHKGKTYKGAVAAGIALAKTLHSSLGMTDSNLLSLTFDSLDEEETNGD